jgi:L-fucose mutarotase/ribose pyranase (RbsD/FucU family)
MLYADGVDALQGKSLPSALSGELSRLATLKGTGDAILTCALVTPMRPRAKMAQALMLKGMSMGVVARVVVEVVVVDAVVPDEVVGEVVLEN